MNQQAYSSELAFTLRSGILASLVWGGWAYYVNESTAVATGLIAGLTQGLASFLMTFMMVQLTAYMINHISLEGIGLLIPSVVTVSTSTCFSFAAHSLAQTPNVLATILPATCVAFVFCLVATVRLRTQTSPKPIR